MEHRFIFSQTIEKELEALDAQIHQRIVRKLLFWEATKIPLFFGTRLIGTKDRIRFRVGDYRVICAVEGEFLKVLKIAHRKEVYE